MSFNGNGGQVLLLTELFPPAIGGSAVLFDGIYSRLDGLDVSVVADGPDGSPPIVTEGRPRILRRPVATSRWGVLDLRGLRHHLRVARLVTSLADRHTAIVHCGRALPEGTAAMFARLMGGPPYLCWAHGEELTALSSRELALLTKAVYRRAAAALANSENTASLLQSLGVPRAKIHVVHPAVDAVRFNPTVDGRAVRARYACDGDIMLLSVGRLQRRKGQDVAIRAVADLRHQLPNLRYVIAGAGDELGRLQQLAADNGVADRVFFAGPVSDGELPAYYAACDIFLLPNRVDDGDIEGFGIVFLEAAASGRVAIGGDSGGVPEAIERDVSGLLVDGASVECVAAAIRDLAASRQRRCAMGQAGRARVVRSFNWDRAAAAVAAVHRQLVSR